MTLATVSWVRNEADVIEPFVRHHVALGARMTIVCHRCTDMTLPILRALQTEGLPLTIREDDSPMHLQADCLTEIMRDQSLADACDWILPLDADEFLVASGSKSIEAVFAGLPRDRVTLLPLRTYVPYPSDDKREANVLKRITHARTFEPRPFSKVLIPRTLLTRDARLTPGSHRLLDGEGKPAMESLSATLHLAHFPVRTERQLRKKIGNGWMAVIANPKREESEAFHWRILHDLFTTKATLTDAELGSLALFYTTHHGDPVASLEDAPVKSDLRLRYTRAPAAGPLQKATRLWRLRKWKV